MATVMTRRKEAKQPVEKLQEEHLTGPADESIDEVAEALQVDKVAVVTQKPNIEKITFRNQRDPGHPLEFHYHSKTSPFKMYKLIDGHQYDLPTEVVKNLEGCREDIHKYRKSSEGIPQVYVAGYKSHFVCERA